MVPARVHTLGSICLIFALLAAPTALATSGLCGFAPEVQVPAGVADCSGGCCGDLPTDAPVSDCCTDDLAGCSLPCCSGLTSTAAGPAISQEPGAAEPTSAVVESGFVPAASPEAIEHPPRA